MFWWMTAAILGAFSVGVIAGILFGIDHPREVMGTAFPPPSPEQYSPAACVRLVTAAPYDVSPRNRPWDWTRDGDR